MDTLPQGLPQDTRDIVQRLKDDPFYGGPPASGPGEHPDTRARGQPLLYLPLPNIEGVYRDDLPCHITRARLRAHARHRLLVALRIQPTLDLTTLRVADLLHHWGSSRIIRYFASQQPLTVRPLADGSNILLARFRSVEFPFRYAFQWYTKYLEWLHYESITDERIDRLAFLRRTVFRMRGDQFQSMDAEENQVNGLYAMTPLLQDWIWPWQFFSVWDIRQELLLDDDNPARRVADMTIKVLNMLVLADSRLEDMMMAQGMPEDRFVPVLDVNNEDTPLQDWRIEDCDVAIRNINTDINQIFHLKALRHWGFKRPWKMLWLVFNPREATEDEDDQQLCDRAVVEVQQRLHADVHGSQLMTFHPILPRQVNDKVDSCPLAACGGDPWKSNDQIMETVCGHFACVDCMITYWFNHVRELSGTTASDWPCPFCRQSAGKLRTRINIIHTQGLGRAEDELADALPY